MTFGTSPITAAGDSWYNFGIVGKKAIHPSPKTSLLYRATGVNAYEVPAGNVWKRFFDCTGLYAIGMQNGVLLESAMGYSSTAGPVGGVYTHTITAPTDGTGNPSFTIQHEKTGTATAWSTQFTGCKVSDLTLTCGFEQKYLIARLGIMAKKATKVAFQMTNDPALPATATTSCYTFGNLTRTWDYGGTPIALNGLIEMELQIVPDLTAIRAHTWDTGVYTGHWLYQMIEGARKKYSVTMELTPEMDDIWDELASTAANTKEVLFKWTKSASDYIQVTCTDCTVIEHELITPETGDEDRSHVVFEPRSLSFEVKDTIAGNAGGAYGE